MQMVAGQNMVSSDAASAALPQLLEMLTSNGDSQALCLHQLCAAQAARTPDAIAVLDETGQLSYRELDRRANQLAHYLRRRNVGPETLVGISVERSIEMVIGLLGILKAGGAYVPLDPEYPPERLRFMLHDAQVAVLLTQARLGDRLRDLEIPAIRLDADWPAIGQEPEQPPASGTSAANLAYMIYTSGSTGQPKGALNTHGAIVNRLLWMQDSYRLSADDRVLQKTPFSFDVSVWEFFWPLISGATLVLARPGGHRDSDYLIDLIRRQQITTLHFVPSMLAVFLNADGVASCTSIRQVFSSGEALSWDLQARFFQQLSAQLHNLYGPTEAAVDVTFWACDPESQEQTVPIGRPVANTQIYILDEHGQPVVGNMPGELYIGGVQVARGYHRRPDLTAEKFVPDPFSHPEGTRPGARLYRSGDLARFRDDGAIEYLGRLDQQVKLRGFRIELGEIEAVLRQHPAVRDAVVILREDQPGDKRLVAYLVEEQGAGGESRAAELRQLLQQQLPEYMLPSAFVVLDEFPLTPNGKLDRRALPAPGRTRADLTAAFVAPRTAIERGLAAIWSRLFGMEQIGIHDDFLELGGHSLLATQMIARIRQEWQISLALRSIFEARTIAELAPLLELQQHDAPKRALATIQPTPRDGALPLSYSQERIWFIQQLNPACRAYQFQATLRFSGELDIAALQRSLNVIVQRHEMLRTTFPALRGRPIQQIHAAWDVELPLVELQDLPIAERDQQLQQLMRAEINKPFDVTQLPLIRWTLFRLRPDEHLLLQVEHHLIHDGWSFNVLLQEILDLYTACVRQGSISVTEPLPPLPIQFADFAVWQRQWASSSEADAQAAFWKEHLKGAPMLLELPTDYPRPAMQRFVGAAPRLELAPDLCNQLRHLSRKEGVTLFVTLLSAFNLMLSRYSGQTELLVGSAIANRRLRETEPLIGMTVNNVVLRGNLAATQTVRDLLHHTRAAALAAYDHQDLPFDRVVEELQPPRDLSRNPLVQVMFSFHDSPLRDLAFPGLTTELTVALSNFSAKFDMNIIAIPRSEQRVGSGGPAGDEGITCVWEYNSDLFAPATIERMFGHYQTILTAFVQNPDQRLIDVPMLLPAEWQQILAWSQSPATLPADRWAHELVAEQAARAPEALALVSGQQRLSFAELNRRANQLARHLQTLGVGAHRETAVAVLMQRSPELLIALLAILKAGGCYVPLDPAYPRERLDYMLADSGAAIVLTHSALAEHLRARQPSSIQADRALLCLDQLGAMLDTYAASDLDHAVAGEHLAYIMYTSGSTGRPKGTAITQRGLAHYLLWSSTAYAIAAGSGMPVHSSIGFDLTVTSLFAPLIAGCPVTLLPEDQAIEALGTALAEQADFSAVKITPAHLDLINQTLPPAVAPGSTRALIIGGEALYGHSLSFWRENAPQTRIINEYGPTETVVGCCVYELGPDDSLTGAIPIGRPIADTQIYLLDRHGLPVALGVVGEVYIGGVQLARGYHGRPDLTAERFVPDPFSHPEGTRPGGRLYKTGDLARFRVDGTLEYLGRRDRQVKLRGYRIELGEIEAALQSYPGVQEAVVVAREDVPGDKRLVAYVTGEQGNRWPAGRTTEQTDEQANQGARKQPELEQQLRGFLRERLPAYMVPSAFVMIERVPLTVNGKLDLAMLPAPDADRPDLAAAFVAPETPEERALAEIWADVLRLERVGIHDNFFDLGGHSLLGTAIIAQILDRFQVELPLRTLFESPTVAGMAAALARQRQAAPIRRSTIQRVQRERQDLDALLAEIDQLSDEAAQALLDRTADRDA
jgi:amino acid adenylation domain-containing protein